MNLSQGQRQGTIIPWRKIWMLCAAYCEATRFRDTRPKSLISQVAGFLFFKIIAVRCLPPVILPVGRLLSHIPGFHKIAYGAFYCAAG